MSRKGTPADNAPIESFHSSLKSETFYINNQLNSSNHIVIDIVEKYIKNYNNNRIQQKLGYLSCKIQRISSLEHSVFIKFPF